MPQVEHNEDRTLRVTNIPAPPFDTTASILDKFIGLLMPVGVRTSVHGAPPAIRPAIDSFYEKIRRERREGGKSGQCQRYGRLRRARRARWTLRCGCSRGHSKTDVQPHLDRLDRCSCAHLRSACRRAPKMDAARERGDKSELKADAWLRILSTGQHQ